MKKLFALWVIILFTFTLSSCEGIKTYQDLDLEFTTHLEYYKEDYQSKIDYYNTLSTRTILSVVKIETINYMPFSSSTGSGVIFTQDDTNYFILTNNHVTYSENEGRTDFSVYDYQGNKYTATLLASDTSYDLAVLKMPKGDLVIENLIFSSKNPMIDERIAILGYPHEQANAITLGKVLSYQNVNISNPISDVIKVDFDVIVSDTPVKQGSSGSVVVNNQFQVIGILFAGNFGESEDFSTFSFSIPVEKVIEFLLANDFKYEEAAS
ncbi:MAG: serine protease [Acholeplasmataceae bacterium]|nr:trypsin-like peptidase domain-containing protein [Acholeplasmataceae bacterium]